MERINKGNICRHRRSPKLEEVIDSWDDEQKLYVLASETERYWDELNAKLFLERVKLAKYLLLLDPGTEDYIEINEQFKRVELLYQDVLLQIRFTFSYSGRGKNPYLAEKEWEENPMSY